MSAHSRWPFRLLSAGVGVFVSALPPRPLALEQATVSEAHGLSLRKGKRELSPKLSPLLGTLVQLHSGQVVALDDQHPSQREFSDMLRDRVTGARKDLHPKLLKNLRAIARRHRPARIELISGYRSEKLNEMLRKKGHHVATRSQHSLGKAVDFRVIGLTPLQLRKEIQRHGWPGGVGQYNGRTDRFVHMDMGRKRFWRGK